MHAIYASKVLKGWNKYNKKKFEKIMTINFPELMEDPMIQENISSKIKRNAHQVVVIKQKNRKSSQRKKCRSLTKKWQTEADSSPIT